MKLLSAPTESILRAKEKRLIQCNELKQTALKRCSVLIAFFDRGVWRLRFWLVLTPQIGVLVHKMMKTLHMVSGKKAYSSESEYNTIAVIGFVPKNNNFDAVIRVHANTTGEMSDD